MSVYNYKNHYAFQPVGSIIEYLGASDPDGWIICDGKERTNNSDGRYNSLYNLGIGSGGNGTNNYIPPNLANYFLLGASTNTSVGNTGGTGSVQLTSDNLPSHNHSMQHGHYCSSAVGGYSAYGYGTIFQIFTTSGIRYSSYNVPIYGSGGVYTSTSYDYYEGNRGGNDIKYNTGNAGNAQPSPIGISPPSFTVNYILQY